MLTRTAALRKDEVCPLDPDPGERCRSATGDPPSAAERRGRAGPQRGRTQRSRPLSILVVDPLALTRECLTLALQQGGRDFRVAALPIAAADPGAWPSPPSSADPVELVLLHLGSARIGDPAGQAMVQRAKALAPGADLVVIAADDGIGTVALGLRQGVRGYISLALGLEVMVEALRLVGAGGTFIPATALHRLIEDGVEPPSPEPAGPPGLTPKQAAVLGCLRQGKPNKIIAHELGMCESTVKVHVRNILKKLGATNRTEAAYLTYAATGRATGA